MHDMSNTEGPGRNRKLAPREGEQSAMDENKIGPEGEKEATPHQRTGNTLRSQIPDQAALERTADRT